MCGIVGYVGENDANAVLINGLRKLEYRGYDSCGIATITQGKLSIHKTLNRIDSLASILAKEEESHIGIGHTRWATHGGVYEKNAHPHTDNENRYIVVHNGIIENYLELKEMLKNNGYTFYSDTDTEVVPKLISMYDNGNLLETVKKVIDKLEGSFAFGIMCKDHPDKLIATKRNSPLIVGLGDNENFIASDFSAVLKYTNKIAILENDEIAVLNEKEIKIYRNDLSEKEIEIKEIETSDSDSEKNGYDHFMLKEIYENPITIKKTLDTYLKEGRVNFTFNLSEEDFRKVHQIQIVACGTAMHAGLNAKNVIEKLTRIPVQVSVASEFRYSDPILTENDLVIFISQSGETADTIACLELIKKNHIRHISVVNVKESTMDRLSDNVVYTMAGPEIAVASTKAYIAQVILLDLFAIYLAEILDTYDKIELSNMLHDAMELPTKVQEVLEKASMYHEYANEITNCKDVFFLGRGLDYYVALEGSLKLKEISYIHSEGTQFGELKHGPIALIEEGTPAIVLANVSQLVDKTVSNIKEIKARGAKVLVITTLKDFPKDVADQVIYLPETNASLFPLEVIIPLQLIAYYVTTNKGLDVDKPRNLAKSVTVE